MAFTAVKKFAKAYPMSFAAGIATTKMTAADLFTQKVVESRVQIDWQRTAGFASFGFVQIGVIQYNVFSKVLPRLFPGATRLAGHATIGEKLKDLGGIKSVVAMTLFHEFLVTPFEIFPAFYIFHNICSDDVKTEDVFSTMLTEYQKNFWEDNKQSICLFIPANLVNFFFMPVHLRTPFATIFGLIWAVMLSATRGGSKPEAELKESCQQVLESLGALNTQTAASQVETDFRSGR